MCGFFFLRGGGLSAQNVGAPLRKPKAPPPQCLPTEKNPSYATVCSGIDQLPPLLSTLRSTGGWTFVPPLATAVLSLLLFT